MRKRPDITELNFDQQVQQLTDWARSQVSPFGDRDKATQERRKKRALKDYFYFVRTYLPHYATVPSAKFHRDLIEAADTRPDPKVGVVVPATFAAPRFHAKSTHVSFGYPLHQAVFGLRNFMIPASETASLAEEHVASIGAELIGNERIRYDFGPKLDTLRDGELIIAGGAKVLARGAGQQIRGLKHRAKRPDYMALDDLENDESAVNPKRVNKLLRWVKSACLPGLDPSGNMVIVGTIIDRKSALAIMLYSDEEPYRNWRRKVYKAIDEHGQALWPDLWPLEKLEALKRSMGPVDFNRELLNTPTDPDAAFQESWLRHYSQADLDEVRRRLLVVGWLDPAVRAEEIHDYWALITLGLDRVAMRYYVLDAYVRRCSVDKAIAAAEHRHKMWGYNVMAYESNAAQAFLGNMFAERAKKTGIPLPLRGVTNLAPKDSRVLTLSAPVENGQILFRPGHSDQDLLMEQLIYYPSKTVGRDGPDALAGAYDQANRLVAAEVAYESAGKRRWANDDERRAW